MPDIIYGTSSKLIRFDLLLLGLTALLFFDSAQSKEHPACLNIDFDHNKLTSIEMRSIAGSCNNNQVTTLYKLRASHTEVFLETKAEIPLVLHHNSSFDRQYEAHKIYIGLIEAFAPIWYPNPQDRIYFLNKGYSSRVDIAELKIDDNESLPGTMNN